MTTTAQSREELRWEEMSKSFRDGVNQLKVATEKAIELIMPNGLDVQIQTKASVPLAEMSEAELKVLAPLSIFRLKGKKETSIVYVPADSGAHGSVVRVHGGEVELWCSRQGSTPGLWTRTAKLADETDAVM